MKDSIAATKVSANQPCGIVMPISSFGEYETQHWLEVRAILERAIKKAGYKPAPVWERSETDIIQGRIVQNLYEYKVAVCDISGLNPNVMFELGLRLAFKKPVVITVDNETKIPFDTNVIEHIIYDRGLNFKRTEDFIERVKEKIENIIEMTENGSYVSYIDALGAFKTFVPNPQKVEFDQFVLDKLEQISANVSRLRREQDETGWGINTSKHQGLNALNVGRAPAYTDSRGWTEARQESFIQLWEDGRTVSEIAEIMGLTSNAVIREARYWGLITRPVSEGSE